MPTNNTPLFHIPEYFAVDIGHFVNLKSQKSLLFRIFGEHHDCDYIGKAYDAEPNPLPCSKADITKRLAFSDAPYNCITQIFQNVNRQTGRENIEFIGTANCLSTVRNFFSVIRVSTPVPASSSLYSYVMLVLQVFGKLQSTSKRTAPKRSRNNNIMVQTNSSA